MDKKKIKVEITEILQRTIEVEANSDEKALDTVINKYRGEKIILDYGDFIDKEIKIIKER